MRRNRNKNKQHGGVPGRIGQGRFLSVLILSAVILVGAAGVTWSQTPTSAKDYVLVKLADLAKETGNVEIASKLLDSLSIASPETFGATAIRNTSQGSNFSQIGLVDSDGDAVLREGYDYQRVLFTTTTPVSWQNKTLEDIWIGPIFGRMIGTASSSFYISAGTSTVNSVAYNTNQTNRSLLDNYFIATSTVNAMFDSQYGFEGSTNSGTATGTNKYLLVKPNEYLLVSMRTQDPKWAVTSTGDMGLSDRSYLGWKYLTVSTSSPR